MTIMKPKACVSHENAKSKAAAPGKIAAALLLLLLILCFAGCKGKNDRELTTDVICGMATEKGESLTWSDLERYEYEEVGSGLYIRLYEVKEGYQLRIGGVPDEKPMYMKLARAGDFDGGIDVRYDDVEEFLKKNEA